VVNEQPEALRLAAHAEANSNFGDMKSIAAELRRLHQVNQELLEALGQTLNAMIHLELSDSSKKEWEAAKAAAYAAITKATGEQK